MPGRWSWSPAAPRRPAARPGLQLPARLHRGGVDNAGLGRPFEVTLSAHEVAAPKPAPEPYLEACRLLGVEPGQRSIALEDSPTGVAAARAAGLSVIGVPASPGSSCPRPTTPATCSRTRRCSSGWGWPGERRELVMAPEKRLVRTPDIPELRAFCAAADLATRGRRRSACRSASRRSPSGCAGSRRWPGRPCSSAPPAASP